MKPYAFDPNASPDTGCCPEHDNPPTRRWSQMKHSAHASKKHRKWYRKAARSRRRRDKQNLNQGDKNENYS